jgi:hypothetical protein
LIPLNTLAGQEEEVPGLLNKFIPIDRNIKFDKI